MDNQKYQIALELFLHTMSNLADPLSPEAEKAAKGLFDILRIAKLSAKMYENPSFEARDAGREMKFYVSGEFDEEKMISKRYVTKADKVIVYYVCQWKGDEPWNSEEREKVDLILDLIFVLVSRQQLSNMLERMTYFDDDGFRNHRYFMYLIGKRSREGKLGGCAAVHFNLKHFSLVNQQIGRNNGTAAMKGFIGKLTDMLGDKGVVCRVGGDNFSALLNRSELDKLLDLLRGTHVVYDQENGSKIRISATAGVYLIPEGIGEISPSDIMDRIITVSQIARSGRKEDVVFYNDVISANKEKMMQIQGMFPKAVENEEFLVYYQPKIALDGGSIAGAEALCRWCHEGRIVPPVEFIPFLEMSSDICKLDFYMLDHVCRDIRRWLDEGREIVRISVNLSRKHMMDLDLLGNILEIIDRNKVPHKYIEIELTETTTDVEFRDLKRVVSGLQNAGIYTSVDDFGIGYSSLNLIKEVPWNVLKVDRSFLPVENDEEFSRRSVMFKYVVAMAQELGLECIAEGVETQAQVDILKDNHCGLAQGFFFDRPLPVKDFEKRLAERNYRL